MPRMSLAVRDCSFHFSLTFTIRIEDLLVQYWIWTVNGMKYITSFSSLIHHSEHSHSTSHIHTFIQCWYLPHYFCQMYTNVLQRHFGVKCLARGHVGMLTGGSPPSGLWTTPLPSMCYNEREVCPPTVHRHAASWNCIYYRC